MGRGPEGNGFGSRRIAIVKPKGQPYQCSPPICPDVRMSDKVPMWRRMLRISEHAVLAYWDIVEYFDPRLILG